MTKGKISESKMPEQEINHMEEVIICTEQGTTFPTKIGTITFNENTMPKEYKCEISHM